MTNVKRILRGGSRNQSTADYFRQNTFLYGNRYNNATFNNSTGGVLTAETGILVVRDVVTGKIKPIADDGSDLANIIGVLDIYESEMQAGEDKSACYCICGDIDGGELVLPTNINLDTTVGSKNLIDILTGIGFCVKNVSENSKFDN